MPIREKLGDIRRRLLPRSEHHELVIRSEFVEGSEQIDGVPELAVSYGSGV
jgi:hypothetical protein